MAIKFQGFDLSSDNKQLSTSLIQEARNFRLAPEGYFINDRGTEALKLYKSGDDSHEYTTADFEPMRFFKVWSRRNNSEVYYLVEQNGSLFYEWGNGDGESGVDREVLSSNRYIPLPQEVGTQLIELGNVCLLANGEDPPVKFQGRGITRKFGYFDIPPSPRPYNIDPHYITNAGIFDVDGSVCLYYADGSGTGTTGFEGLTEETESGPVNYGYKVSFVDDTGSESPLSDEGVLSFYVDDVTATKQRYIGVVQIPIGTGSTVARRVYRTKMRQRGASGSGDYYLVKQVNDNTSTWISDHFPDSMLTTYAPGYPFTNAGYTVVPIRNFNYGVIHDGRLWVSGGSYENTVLYSKSNRYAQFEAIGSIPLGSGGRVTGLVTHEGRLYVFRENSIDYIYRQDDGSYSASTLSSEIGTTATNTIKATKGFGLCFLTTDGIYSISGGQLVKVSTQIDKFFRRLNISALPRATACYNPIEKEYWCHFCVDGKTDNSHGVVLHHNGFWSFRMPSGSNNAFGFTHLDFDGKYTIAATNPWDNTGSVSPINGTWRNLELMVWSNADQYSDVWDNGQLSSGNITFTKSPGSKSNSLIETTWLTLGDPSGKKTVKTIEIVALGTGDENIPLSYALNGKYEFTSVTTKKARHSESKLDTADACYENSDKYDGVYGTSKANGYRTIYHRYDLDTKEVNSIKLRISTSSLVGIQGMIVYFEQTNTMNHR